MRTLKSSSVLTTAVSSNNLSSNAASDAVNKLNFVIIFCSDMGYGGLGCYRNPTIRTPNIDRMTREGMELTQFYVGAGVSTPSRATLMTKRLPVQNRLYRDRVAALFPNSKVGLGQDEVTVARVLQQSGYAIGRVGKWHLGAFLPYLLTGHGFDTYLGIPYPNDMSPVQNKGTYARSFPPTPLILDGKETELEPDQGELTRRYMEKAISLIKDHSEEPSFLYSTYTFPYIPLYTNARFKGTSRRGLYRDVVGETDWSVEEVSKAPCENGSDENTFVIFTSDNDPWLTEYENGGSAGPLRDGKGTWWEGSFRVPAIYWMPGKVNPATNDEIMISMDLYPTFLSMAGTEQLKDLMLDGVNQTGLLFEEKHSTCDKVYYWWRSGLMAVRKGKWKYYFKMIKDQYLRTYRIETSAEPLLYNVGTDISERFSQAEKHPEIVKLPIETGKKHKKGMKVKPSVRDMM